SVKHPATRATNPIVRSAAPSSIAPASEVIMPPSKAATTARPSTGANPNKSALHSVRIGLPPASETNRSCNTIFSDPGPRCTYPFEKSGLKVKLPARNIAWYRDPAAILIDQLKEIWIEAELETVETANWVPKLMRKDFTVAMSLSGS